MKKARTHRDLDVYRRAMDVAMRVFEVTRAFPKEETYSLTNQVRRSSRSVCANLAEAWRKRRYELVFVSKLSDSEAEAAETQFRIEFAVKCGYLPKEEGTILYKECDAVIATLVGMMTHPKTWILEKRR